MQRTAAELKEKELLNFRRVRYVIGEMFPPSQGLRLDIDAISQIFGSISIACWIGKNPFPHVKTSHVVWDGVHDQGRIQS